MPPILQLDHAYFPLGCEHFGLYGGRKGSDSLQAMLRVGEVDFGAILKHLFFSLSLFFWFLIMFTVLSLLLLHFCLIPSCLLES